MAFLRSVARCNSLVLKRLPSSVRGSIEFRGSSISRSDLLASHRYYAELQRDLNVRCQSTAAAAAKPAESPSGSPPRDALDVSFNNPEAAFKSKTTWELVRAYLVYMICSSGYIVENNLKVTYFIDSFWECCC